VGERRAAEASPRQSRRPSSAAASDQLPGVASVVVPVDDGAGRKVAVAADKPMQSKLFGASTTAREMCSAAAAGDLDEIRRLVRKGADVNAADYDGRTALHVAAASRGADVAAFLLEQPGVNVNALDSLRNTPLQDAIKSGNARVAAMLRERGASVVSKALGAAMCAAAWRGNLVELAKLVESGADVNVADYDGRTALHLAAAEGHVEMVKWLLLRGARAVVVDRWGRTPADDAGVEVQLLLTHK
jgi:ankyrin repeat protein